MMYGDIRTGLEAFLEARDPVRALTLWLASHHGSSVPASRESLLQQLATDVAHLDSLINAQLNAILHHPRFQQLEASWRGLQFLTAKAEDAERVNIRILSLSWAEATRDISRAIEFDQSQLFRKIYNEEFGLAGGKPYGVLLADYEIHHRPKPDWPHDDIATLQGLSHIAAAAFTPLIVGVDPTVFGLDRFAGLEMPFDLSDTFRGEEYTKWRAFRDTDDARFVGLTLPRTLMRLPYADGVGRSDGFRFREDVRGPDSSRYLWGTAVYAFGSVLVRAFSESGWLADIQGVHRGREDGGLVTGLATEWFATNRVGAVPKYTTDVLITDAQEKELTDLGFIPLCACKDTGWAAFYSNSSAHSPKAYDRVAATVNARLSAGLQYIFCASRFSHYVKVMARDKVGSFLSAEDCQSYLQNWLHKYCTASEDASIDLKAKYPLREGRVEVRERPGSPGSYFCIMHLKPHFQLDQVATSVKLVTELAPAERT
ncbi:MAG: type VI secretion system contractile sheath large subunit [Gammaproteobacteria bacterium]